jgi:hypothetical protein
MSNYYSAQLALLKDKTTLSVQFTDYAGNKTKVMQVNSESVDNLIFFLKGERRRISEEISATEKELMTSIIFKKEGTEVCAVMPYEIADRQGNVTSYAHVGQHSACSLDYVNKLKNAKEEEYATLKSELESAGYKINVIKKIVYGKYVNAYAKVLKWK